MMKKSGNESKYLARGSGPVKKLRKKTGASIAETMVALIIISLLSMSIATGVAFGARQYSKSTARSEARILCSSLTSMIQDELRNTTEVQTAADGSLLGYRSTYFQTDDDALSRFDDNGDTYITVVTGTQTFRLLGEAAYSGGDNITTELKSVTYDDVKELFSVSLVVHTKNAGDVQSDFNVIPLNSVKVL